MSGRSFSSIFSPFRLPQEDARVKSTRACLGRNSALVSRGRQLSPRSLFPAGLLKHIAASRRIFILFSDLQGGPTCPNARPAHLLRTLLFPSSGTAPPPSALLDLMTDLQQDEVLAPSLGRCERTRWEHRGPPEVKVRTPSSCPTRKGEGTGRKHEALVVEPPSWAGRRAVPAVGRGGQRGNGQTTRGRSRPAGPEGAAGG